MRKNHRPHHGFHGRQIKIGGTALNSPSKAEAARQERNDDHRKATQ
jgi:hypothetical protein